MDNEKRLPNNAKVRYLFTDGKDTKDHWSTKTVLLEQLKEVRNYKYDYPLYGCSISHSYEHSSLTNEVIGTYRVKKETLLSKYTMYDNNEKYVVESYHD